jgi:hypothetical protein
MSKLLVVALAVGVSTLPAVAAETIGAMGGEKCGGAVKDYAVEFLSPEDAPVEARVKALIGGNDDTRDTTSLTVDGVTCSEGRCAFRAKKGQTYRLSAKSTGKKVDELCISVSRPS